MYHFYHIMSGIHIINVTYLCWYWPWSHDWVVFLRLPHCKITLPPLFMLYSWEESHYAQRTLKQWVLYPASWKAKYLHKLLGILLHGGLVCSPFLFLKMFYLYPKCWNNKTTPKFQWHNTRLISCSCRDVSHGSGSDLLCIVPLAPKLTEVPPWHSYTFRHIPLHQLPGRQRALEGFAPAVKCFSLSSATGGFYP